MTNKTRRRIGSIAGVAKKEFEPYEPNNPIPWLVLAVALVLAAWGVIALLTNTTSIANETVVARSTRDASDNVAGSTAQGEQLFASNCATCHQPNGSGIADAVPPLAGSPYVVSNAEVPVNIVLFGLAGEIQVGDGTYRGRMPTFGDVLSNEEIASIVTHVRSSWSNQAGGIDADFVATQRKRFSQRDAPWAGAAELAQVFDMAVANGDTQNSKAITHGQEAN